MERHRKLWFTYVLFEHNPKLQSYKYNKVGSVHATSDLTVGSIKNLIYKGMDVSLESVQVCVYQVCYKFLNAALLCAVHSFQPKETSQEANNLDTCTLMDENLRNTVELLLPHELPAVREKPVLIVTFCTAVSIKISRKPLTPV